MKDIFYCDKNYIKSSLHTIAPYIGKLRPELVSMLIDKYSLKTHTIFDPFCGSGTVLLEAWIKGRNTIGVDLNDYAFVLTKAKLFPYQSLEIALQNLEINAATVKSLQNNIKLNNVPDWVSKFFHPETLKEIIVWMAVLIKNNEYFLVSCLLGILHHQRPGFLSFPSSHGAPYLRNERYPINEYPEMYEYRNVFERLHKKVIRTYTNVPSLDISIKREVYHMDTQKFDISMAKGSTIITSPPYMKSLTYARDNRLRLWFLGHSDWGQLDKSISVNKANFSKLMKRCFKLWAAIQNKSNYCVLVVGDILFNRASKQSVPDLICADAKEFGYNLIDIYNYPVNTDRKVAKVDSQIKTEKICVFQRS